MSGSGQIYISEFNKPDTVSIFNEVQIYAKAQAMNGCWHDITFDFEKLNNFEYSIKAFALYTNYSGKCPEVLVIQDTIIYFQPTQKGSYIFNIFNTQDSVTVDTLIVN
jgi:hypothetical protein